MLITISDDSNPSFFCCMYIGTLNVCPEIETDAAGAAVMGGTVAGGCPRESVFVTVSVVMVGLVLLIDLLRVSSWRILVCRIA